jgi:hypothetical protein
VSLIGG